MTDNPRLFTGRRWAQLALIAAVAMYGIVGFPNPADPELSQAAAHPQPPPGHSHTPRPRPRPRPQVTTPPTATPPASTPPGSRPPNHPGYVSPPAATPPASTPPGSRPPNHPGYVSPPAAIPPTATPPASTPPGSRPPNHPGYVSPPAAIPPTTTPGNTTPGNTTPGNTTPGNTTPGNTTPVYTTPVYNRPVYNRPVYTPPAATPVNNQNPEPEHSIETTCGTQEGERVGACGAAIDGGYRETDEEEFTPVDDVHRAKEMGEQFVNHIEESGKRVTFDADAYQHSLDNGTKPPQWKDGMQAACAGLGDSGCPTDATWGEQHKWLHENEITSIDPDDQDFPQDKPLLNGHTSLIFYRIGEDFTEPGWHPPVDDDDSSSNTNIGSTIIGGGGPTCTGSYGVIAAHISADDNGCRPDDCPFGRGADGWCSEPDHTNPPVIYVRGPGNVDEDAGRASFQVVLSHPVPRTVTVTVATQDGTATANSDYTPVNRRVTLRPNHTVAHVSVSVTDDTRHEPDETFTLRLSNPSANASLHTSPQAEASIADDDAPPFLGAVTNLNAVCVSGQITLSWGPPSLGTVNDYRYGIYEDEFLVRRVTSGTTTATQVTVDVTDTTKTYYAEVQARGGLNPNNAGWLETAGFTCAAPPPLVVSLADTSLAVVEGSSVQITATLDTTPSGIAAVRFTTSGATGGIRTCSNGANFSVNRTSFVFNNSDTASVTLHACDDTDTDDEMVTLALTTIGITELELGSPTRVVVSITDDDTAQTPVVSLTSTTLTVDEMQSIQVTASLDVVPSSTASVRFTLSGATNGNGSCSTGADFYLSDTEFTFMNTTSASVTLHACDDTDTTDETVTLALTTLGITELQLGSPIRVVVTITDDDTASAPLLK